jgi:2-polyprenyl-6-hydroxyphenyl methylase/3-demethylubiquinone-9 3-methyltransferase
MKLIRGFLNANVALCRAINRRLPWALRTEGNYWFQENVLRNGFEPNQIVYDIGGGSRPWFTPEEKRRLNLTVVGLDISEEELRAAPAGSYDKMVAADVCGFIGDASSDAAICQALLEHVPDTKSAIRAIASTLKPSGVAYFFIPCRNAPFAQLNRILPQELKRKILYSIWPYAAEGHDGFRAYYDNCSPSKIEAIARLYGLEVKAKGTFWASGYFYFFFPAYLVWRFYQLIAWCFLGEDGCESFFFVFRKSPGVSGGGSCGAQAMGATGE